MSHESGKLGDHEKNQSQQYQARGGRIVINKKKTPSMHENIKLLRERLSEASTKPGLDENSSIQVSLPDQVHPSSKNNRYRVEKVNPYENQ